MKKILLSILALLPISNSGATTQDNSFIPDRIQDGVILHCFVWPLRDIINELPAIADAGFGAIQISPMQAPNTEGQPWYYTYGPCDYRFYESVLGTRTDLVELCEKASSLGIKIIMDIAPNHLMRDDYDRWRAPQQYTSSWWREDNRMVIDQGNVKWDSRWSMTNQNIFGFEVLTDRPDVQTRMREFLADLYSMGVRGIRWDSAKHIAVPSEGDDFWKMVLPDTGLWHYGEILNQIDYAPELITEYAEYMSMTDSWFGGYSENNFRQTEGVPRQKCVFWAESHDTFSNDQDNSQKLSQNDIDRTWALVASRQGATALYFSRPGLLPKDDIKLAVKGSTHFTSPEVREVNRFHNIMGAEPEKFYSAGNATAVYRRKGAVIVVKDGGKISIPAGNLTPGYQYKDMVTGNSFSLENGKLSGTVGTSGIAVVYDPLAVKAPEGNVSIFPTATVFSTPTAEYTLTPSYCRIASYSINGAPAITIDGPTKITIGEGIEPGETINIKWFAGEGDDASSGEFQIMKADPRDTFVFLHSDTDWSDLNVYSFIYNSDGHDNGHWPGASMEFDSEITINGKTGWWRYLVPQDLKIEGRVLVSTSGTYRYPGSDEPGIPLEGKSIAFEYVGGKWSFTSLDYSDVPVTDRFIEQNENLPSCSWGSIRRFRAHSMELDDDFTVDVLLPDNYDDNRSAGYPVVYVNDGQNLFDASLTWNKTSWEIDEALDKLTALNLIETPIIVGIHNRGVLRPADYIPEKVCVDYIPENQHEASGMWNLTENIFNGDEYAAFVTNSVKKNIDRIFNTLPGPEYTFTMGSSMGALAALYAMCEYPDIYGGAASLSTHWIGDFNYQNTIFPEAMIAYLNEKLPTPATHKLYFDRGTEGLDASYADWEPKIHELVTAKGYNADNNSLMTYLATGATHSESDWSARVDRPLYFLLSLEGSQYNPEEQKDTYHVIFRDSEYSWTAPAAFTWTSGSGNVQLGNWPGTKMTPVTYEGEEVWEIKFEHPVKPTHIIFNDGRASGAVQTEDLPFKNNYVYNFNGPVCPITNNSLVQETESQQYITLSGDELIINSTIEKTLVIYSIDGRSISLNIHPGINRFKAPAPGIYIIDRRKFLIKR